MEYHYRLFSDKKVDEEFFIESQRHNKRCHLISIYECKWSERAIIFLDFRLKQTNTFCCNLMINERWVSSFVIFTRTRKEQFSEQAELQPQLFLKCAKCLFFLTVLLVRFFSVGNLFGFRNA